MYTWISIGIIVTILLFTHFTTRNRIDFPGMQSMRRLTLQLGFGAIFVLLTAHCTGRDIRSPMVIWFSNMISSWRTVAFTLFVLPVEAVAILVLSFICFERNFIM